MLLPSSCFHSSGMASPKSATRLRPPPPALCLLAFLPVLYHGSWLSEHQTPFIVSVAEGWKGAREQGRQSPNVRLVSGTYPAAGSATAWCVGISFPFPSFPFFSFPEQCVTPACWNYKAEFDRNLPMSTPSPGIYDHKSHLACFNIIHSSCKQPPTHEPHPRNPNCLRLFLRRTRSFTHALTRLLDNLLTYLPTYLPPSLPRSHTP